MIHSLFIRKPGDGLKSHRLTPWRAAACWAGAFVVCAAPALAQLTQDDIDALRKQGEREGWTFELSLNEACQYPLAQLCGAQEPEEWELEGRRAEFVLGRDLPSSYDWRDHGGVTSVKNQGGCGSCWAFAAVGAIESCLRINEGWNLNLSEQWLVSCCDSGDCDGGWHTRALSFMTCRAPWLDDCGDCGAVPESEFPYVGWDAPCHCPYSHPYQVDNWKYVGGQHDIEEIKQAIYDYGPVAVSVTANGAFQGYDGGIFNACSDASTNHAVVLVGWDDNLGSAGCWILRNSWGSWWGDGGYMYIEYECSNVGSSACCVEYRYDCNRNGIPDEEEIAQGLVEDCNANGKPDECDIGRGRSPDCNNNGIPDECELSRAGRLYVDRTASGEQTGTDWSNALTDLEAAYCFIQADIGIDEVWVARGTYTPCDDGNKERERSIRLINGVAYRGGFAGYETDLSQRDLSDPSNRTILSGDLEGNDEPGFVNVEDNSYHVLLAESVDETAVLDGFTIIGGNAEGDGYDNAGGGLYNHMGGPTIINCAFVGNNAASYGGAVYNVWMHYGVGESHPEFINCTFTGNRAWYYGGGVGNSGSMFGMVEPRFVNCTFTGNISGSTGSVAGTHDSGVPTFLNCIIWDNESVLEGYYLGQIDGPADFDRCCVEHWEQVQLGEHVLAVNPNFKNPAGADGVFGTVDDNPELNFGSPCIDAGDNSYVPGGLYVDVAGQSRFEDDAGTEDAGEAAGGGAVIDMGAYEYQGITCFADLTGDGRINLQDLGQLLAGYGATMGASYSDGDLNYDGAVNLSDLGALLARYGDSCW